MENQQNEEEVLIFTPGLIEDVISQILSFLSTQELKNVRFVSFLWNQEAARILKNKAVAKFNFNSTSSYQEDSIRLFRYHHEMKQRQTRLINGVVLSIGKMDYGYFNDRDNIKFILLDKVEADLHWIFAPKNNNNNNVLTKLKLDVFIETGRIFDVATEILTLLKDTLIELELGGEFRSRFGFRHRVCPERYQFPSSLRFTRLKSFTLSMKAFQSMTNWTWFELLVQSIQGVTSIHCIGEVWRPEVTEGFLTNLQKSRHLFINLKELDITSGFITSEILEHLDGEILPLKKLSLGRLWLRHGELFHQVLEKYSTSLESLKLILSPSTMHWTLNFPIFPNLKEFEIDFYYTHKRYDVGEEKANCKLLFGDEDDATVDYNKHFPSLQSFTFLKTIVGRRTWNRNTQQFEIINPESWWTFYKPIFDIFFKKTQICKTMRHLSIPYADEENGNLVCPVMSEISAMFPNVHNKWINQVRENPACDDDNKSSIGRK